jgi:hypothetical protein
MPLTRSSACSDPEVTRMVRRAGDAGVARELGHQELAQRPIPLRAACQPVGRERPPFACQHRGCGGNQRVDWHVLGVVVAADEIVFGEAVVLDGRRGKAGGEQGGEVERRGGHRVVSRLRRSMRRQEHFPGKVIIGFP